MSGVEKVIRKTRLPERTRAFVKYAFDYGVVEVLDERRKRTLAEYVFNDMISFEGLRVFLGTSADDARRVYYRAMAAIWEASPPEVRNKFPKEEVIVAKSRAREATPEKKAKLRAALIGVRHTEETKARRNQAIKEKLSSEEVKSKMRVSQRERQRREREARQTMVFKKGS